MIFPEWLVIGFIAQFLWVAGILIDKTLLEKYLSDSEEVDSATSLLFISATFSLVLSLGILIFKGADLSLSPATMYGLLAGMLGGLWAYFYLTALDMSESSRVVPIFQTIPIFGMVFATFFLGEILSFKDIFSIVAIITGAFILSFDFSARKFALKPLILMMVASGAVALQETVFKVGSTYSDYWNVSFWMTLGFPLFMVCLFFIQPRTYRNAKTLLSKKFKKVWFASGFNEAIDNAASLAFVFAITLGPVAVVQSVNAFQPVILLITATILAKYTNNTIGEDLAPAGLMQKTLGILIITGGSLVLYLGFV